ncbi:MAG: N-6 DNA methylase [Microscillaceae bacterium]|jgi:hypothetical protein|nr:N-6 DNA methylase [Microscillaceae bacterium]
MNKAEAIISELEKLNTYNHIEVADIDEIIDGFEYAPIRQYLAAMRIGVKPEDATANLLKSLINDVLSKTFFSEFRLQKGYVDFAIQENLKNPVLIELKALFAIERDQKDRHKTPKYLDYRGLSYQYDQEQVKKYLLDNDFLVLTNLREAFLFDRDSFFDFKPFATIPFTQLLREFLLNESLWDTILRLEDTTNKPNLEQEFFKSLSSWFESFSQVNYHNNEEWTREELIVLLLNKVIFIKTLEDFGLIPFRFLENMYFQKIRDWEPRGLDRVFDNFFGELEDWFWEYYDTDLFKTRIWGYIDKDEKNLKRFKDIFEQTLGFGVWEQTFGKGMVHYNYRKIDEDVFGKAYETFIAQKRKDSGIYYTHRLITQFMSEQITQQLFADILAEILDFLDKEDYQNAQVTFDKMKQIRIVDTCSGSGSFLIKVLREIYHYYEAIDQKTNWIHQLRDLNLSATTVKVRQIEDFRRYNMLDAPRKLLASIILNHIFAIDLDEGALDTGKTNIWKEAVKIKPTFFIYHKLTQRNGHVLPNLAVNYIQGDSLLDLDIREQIEILEQVFAPEIVQMHQIRQQYLQNPFEPEVLEPIPELKKKLRACLETHFYHINQWEGRSPILMALEFFFIYFDENGTAYSPDNQGFDGIISNPPWEIIKPIQKEFYDANVRYTQQIGKYTLDKNEFDQQFAKKIASDEAFSIAWENYKGFYDQYKNYLYKIYQHQGEGDLNFFKLFIERDLELIKPEGFMSLLIPSGFQTDKGGSELRKLLLKQNTLNQLFSFENKGYKAKESDKHKTKIFPDVHPQFKFSIINAQKIKNSSENYDFKGLFYLHHPQDLYDKQPMLINAEMIKRFSADNLSIMEFRSAQDYQLCSKILDTHRLLKDWGYDFRREFHMTDDAKLFHKVRDQNLPLYEGKMIYQFDSKFSPPNYFLNEDEVRKILLQKEITRIKSDLKLKQKNEDLAQYFDNENFKLDYQTYRLVYRSVGGSTNERTLIASMIPPNHFAVHSLNYLINCTYEIKAGEIIQNLLAEVEVVYLQALLNSLTLNYFIRNKISANLTINFLYELPIPLASDDLKQRIIQKSLALLIHKNNQQGEYEALKQSTSFVIDIPNAQLNYLRAELEILIAQELYGLTKTEWLYLTSTFIYGENPTTRQELDDIIRISNDLYR